MTDTDTATIEATFDRIFASALARFGNREIAARVAQAVMLEAYDEIRAGA